MENRQFSLGLDIGSTTVKLVLMEGDRIVYRKYQRHQSDIRGTLAQCLEDIEGEYKGASARILTTGSGGWRVSQAIEVPFVQEVVAETAAVNRYLPETDVIIELGGEDAKITYMKPVPEQRMNGTCAGGTGAFIDQMAQLLQTDAAGLDTLAARYAQLYPIASRCGVFAKTDLQPLLNEGASHADLAASVLQAVVTQTIAGLACGRPIRGKVALLGGPLHFMPSLRAAFSRTLAEQTDALYAPEDAQLYVAIGAALLADGPPLELRVVIDRFRNTAALETDVGRMRPLFLDESERAAFYRRHEKANIELENIAAAAGDCFLGIDAGSTTTKAVLIDSQDRIFFTYYASNKGNPVACAADILTMLYRQLGPKARIARSCVTGYGENLVQAAFGVDEGEIETMTHFRAARHYKPDVDFIIDIGGQDMKCMRVRNGVIDSIILNEACSSGCGSFIQTFAETLGMDAHAFSQEAVIAANPVDLGTRCTVFMNSRVKQAQKEGASVGDISAGLSYAVVRNALYKVIKIRDTAELGKNIVALGGTFLNDAILRCFELVSGREVIRPSIAGLMGAFGAALIARERFNGQASTLTRPEKLGSFRMETSRDNCTLCGNQCKLTVSHFDNGRRFVSGNRCERGAGTSLAEQRLPNLFDYKYKRLFSYRALTEKQAARGTIGIPRVLNIFENYPFWHTVLTRLGFRVVLSSRSTHAQFEKGMETIPSESVCYPAKLVHGHIAELVERGIKVIFYPDLPYERIENEEAGNHYNCPIVTSYPEVIRANMDILRDKQVTYLNPFLPLHHPDVLAVRLAETFSPFGVTLAETKTAVREGFIEQDHFRKDMLDKGDETVKLLREAGGFGVVLAGRPYHVDPEIHHGVPDILSGLGFAVLTEDSVSGGGLLKRPIRVVDQWMYHARLYEAAAFVAETPELELVQLNSFGCGLDAVTSEQAQEILESAGKMFTLLKIDEVSNLGAARIRMRSLKVAMEERRRDQTVKSMDATGSYQVERTPFTLEMKKRHTLIGPQMSPVHFELISAALNNSGYRAVILEKVQPDDVETGLKFVNNDACYPSILVVGQLVNAFISGRFDPENSSILITQTGGACRATNYVAFLRKALRDAGFPKVPIISLSVQGIETNPGFRLSVSLAYRIVKALVLGDLLQTVLLRVRPYEREKGSANRLYRLWLDRCKHHLHPVDASLRRSPYRKLIRDIVSAFASMDFNKSVRKPIVGLVGEILVKFHPDANNNAVGVIEDEGCEARVPGLLDFFLYSFYSSIWKTKVLGESKRSALLAGTAIHFLEGMRAYVRKSLRNSGLFAVPPRIEELAELAEKVLSLGNASGEGWFLTAEMLELIESGVPNIICAQPFACLPNHVTGKGMIREIRRLYPQANIVAVDYDPGASEVNQLNRIKLMIASCYNDVASKQTMTERYEKNDAT